MTNCQQALALKYFSTAAILYQYGTLGAQKTIAQIMSFQESELRAYALARILPCNNDHTDISKQFAALTALQKPSEYLLFFEDMYKFLEDDTCADMLFNALSLFVDSASNLEDKEQWSLATLILNNHRSSVRHEQYNKETAAC